MPQKIPLDAKIGVFPFNYLQPAIAGTGIAEAFTFAASITVRKGEPLVETATPGVLTVGDGTAPVVGLSPFAFTTDSNGNITPGPAGSGTDPGGYKRNDVPVWIQGYFFKTDVPGWSDANIANFGKAKGAKLFRLI